MAEDNDEFDERLEALNEAGMAGDWDKAVKLGEALRAEFPDSFSDNKRVVEYLAIAYCLAEAYYKRGSSYNELKQYERAIKDFDKAIALKSEHAATYHNRGNSYAGLKQYERAITDRDKAIDMARTAKIDERFQRRRKASERRLIRFRKFTGGLFVLLIIAAPFLWFYISG